MTIIKKGEKISVRDLEEMAQKIFGNLVKAVVDIEREIMAVDADLHADEEAVLLEQGSKQQDLWGINLYPEISGSGFVEFDSMINLRPSQNNKSREVEDPEIKKKILNLVDKFVIR
ncbi:MAG: hypothetical protein A3J63_02275 [Candidatus Moranbacteria bacterium RIFCSPHIGHO2_02_FULL_40_12b]|nr:MAG: hypothetical protein A3J63_02275 [Candidatus Moranbacteria bacterium RIFCSPHIGHO2_02_FULL_40_12b]